MEIRRSENGDIHFFDDNGDIYETIYKDFSKYSNAEYNDFVLNKVQHPMCRCSIITNWGYISTTKNLVKEYMSECKNGLWNN